MLKVEYLNQLDSERKKSIFARHTVDYSETKAATAEILERLIKDPQREIIREYSPLKAGLSTCDLLVTREEMAESLGQIKPDVLEALRQAADNISRFHKAQLDRPCWFDEFSPGLMAGRMTRPLERVGVYIPGGRAAYPSSALMNIIPARAAGVEHIVAASPPGPNLEIRPEILAAAYLAGADVLYKLGGAWAVGSMAYGLGGVPRVDKIVGPGSAWVTAAKMAVFGQVDIDLPAGPSEGFIIADQSTPAEWLAWDLVSQLEHDPMAAAVLVTCDEALAQEVSRIFGEILPTLERREIVEEAMVNGLAVLVAPNLDEAFAFSNEYAPEHLEIALAEPFGYLPKVRHAGSVFLGPQAPIAAGDYATGPNHVLPTGFAARMFSGLSTDSFLKKITFQHLSPEALATLAPTVVTLARAEGLHAHAKSVEIRGTRK